MENPNEYDDDLFTHASNSTVEAIGALWEAGASPEDIANVIKDALESEGANNGKGVTVTIEAARWVSLATYSATRYGGVFDRPIHDEPVPGSQLRRPARPLADPDLPLRPRQERAVSKVQAEETEHGT